MWRFLFSLLESPRTEMMFPGGCFRHRRSILTTSIVIPNTRLAASIRVPRVRNLLRRIRSFTKRRRGQTDFPFAAKGWKKDRGDVKCHVVLQLRRSSFLTLGARLNAAN